MTLTMPVNGVSDKLDEIRRNLGKEAENLADMAADYTQQAGEHAADIGDDAATQARKMSRRVGGPWLSDLLKAGAALGTAVAMSGRKSAQDLGDNAQAVAKDVGGNAQSLANELRKVRITTEAKKSGPDFVPGITLLAGLSAGIALMYFLDPERGRERWNALRDKLTAWTRKATQTASGTARELRGQMSRNVDELAKANDDASTTDTWGTQPEPEPVSL